MSPHALLESSRGQFWQNCRNRVRGRFWRNRQTFPRTDSGSAAKPDVATCPTSRRSPSAFVIPDAIAISLRLGRRRRIPAVGFSRATNKLHAVSPWRQEWIATRPSSGPSIWAALLHRTVIRSGLQRHRKVSRLRMVVELPATATPPHGASARASLLSKPSRCHRAVHVPARHRPRTGAISTESRLYTVSPLHVLAITHHTKE